MWRGHPCGDVQSWHNVCVRPPNARTGGKNIGLGSRSSWHISCTHTHTRTHTNNSPYECMKGRHVFELWRHERHTVTAACKQRCPSWVYTLLVSTHTCWHFTHTLYRLISTVSVILVSIQLHSISNPRTHLRKRTVEMRCTSSDPLSHIHKTNLRHHRYIPLK